MAFHSGYMPLYLRADGEHLTNNIPLHTISVSASNSGVSNNIPLYLDAINSGELTSQMNLFLNATTSEYISGTMILYIGAEGTHITNNLQLTLWNSILVSGISLFVQGGTLTGSGNLENGLPGSGYLNLYLERLTSNILPLYLMAPGEPISGVLDLHTQGSIASSGNQDLVMPNTYDIKRSTIELFTMGF